jgi:allantoicase
MDGKPKEATKRITRTGSLLNCMFFLAYKLLNDIHSSRGAPGYLSTAVIDTIHFKGNFPESCDIRGIHSQDIAPDANSGDWKIILPPVKLGPHRMHFFRLSNTCEQYTHVKVSIYPDGGIKRIRIIGTMARKYEADVTEITTQADGKHQTTPIIVEEGWEIIED